MEVQSVFADDIRVERRAEPRVIMSLAGTCQLAAHRDETGKRREYPCRAINMSSQALMLAAPARATLGDGATAYVPTFGKLSGRVIRVLDGGFVMSLMVNEAQRQRIARRLAWMQDHQAHDTRDLRQHARIVPASPSGRSPSPTAAACPASSWTCR